MRGEPASAECTHWNSWAEVGREFVHKLLVCLFLPSYHIPHQVLYVESGLPVLMHSYYNTMKTPPLPSPRPRPRLKHTPVLCLLCWLSFVRRKHGHVDVEMEHSQKSEFLSKFLEQLLALTRMPSKRMAGNLLQAWQVLANKPSIREIPVFVVLAPQLLAAFSMHTVTVRFDACNDRLDACGNVCSTMWVGTAYFGTISPTDLPCRYPWRTRCS